MAKWRSVELREGCVERLGDGGQVAVEQVGVAVERHRRGCVPECALENFRVSARLDREARVCVPQVMRRELLGELLVCRACSAGGDREPARAAAARTDVLLAFTEE